MTISLSVKHDLKRLRKQIRSLPKAQIRPTTNQALNYAGRRTYTLSVRTIHKITGITPQKKIRQAMRLLKSSPQTLRVRIQAFRLSPNLTEYVAKGKRKVGAFNKAGGVKAKAWRQSKTYDGTFIGRGRSSGKLLVFTRSRRKRSGVRALSGPSVRRTFIEKTVNRLLVTSGRQEFIREWRRLAEVKIHRHLSKGKK